MRELDLQERCLKLEEEQLKFQCEQWARRNAEPVFAPRNEAADQVCFVYEHDEVAPGEPDLHVLQLLQHRILKHDEL